MADNDQQHIKSLNTDSRGKNRLRYSSTKERAKTASADVYRSYKRRIGVTSAASREERVHHPNQDESRKRQRTSASSERVAVIRQEHKTDDSDLDDESTFASELDLANDRNASEIFSGFYREIWHLVRSLPEVLHHASEIVDILMSYVLSPESTPFEKCPQVPTVFGGANRETYVVNPATTDILHLLAVLARDLRHEIHPFVHTLIVPRLVYDLLNPPLPPPESGKQPLPMNVTVVEASFRALSYVFRYDSEPLLSQVEKEGQEPCLEKMRQYYGATLGHKRDYVRRLAAETFAPMIRKLKTDSARRRHIRRVLRALAASAQERDNEPISHGLKRTQTDAVDGVSFLLFETARGMSGRLHSKGHQIIRCVLDCMTGGSSKVSDAGSMEMLFFVTSAFVDKICHHVHRESFSAVWKELFRAADTTLSQHIGSDESESSKSAIGYVLELLGQIVSFKESILILKPDKNGTIDWHDDCMKSLVGLLRRLLDPATFRRMSLSSQRSVLKILTTSWRALPDYPGFSAQLSPLLPGILNLDQSESTNEMDSIRPAAILARDLLPFLPGDTGMKLVGRAILTSAAKHAAKDPDHALSWLFAVVSARPSNASGDVDTNDDDNIFFLENAALCNIPSEDKKTLIELCLLNISDGQTQIDRETIARLGVGVRCLPFLLLAGNKPDGDSKAFSAFVKIVWKWYCGSLRVLDQEVAKLSSAQNASPSIHDIVVAKSLLLESCARIAIACADGTLECSFLKKLLTQVRPYGEEHLMSFPHSIWAVKGVAALVDAMGRCDMTLNDSPNQVFEALIPNLRKKSHFLRLHTLEILASYPKRPYVTDHAEIDWTDDLDEEPASAPLEMKSSKSGVSNLPTGLCDVMETLLKLEAAPVNFSNERLIVSCITRLEVLGKTGRLPVLYGEAASNHMLGILYVKFSPIWPAAIRALISLASSQESYVWQPLAERIKEVMNLVDVVDVAERLTSASGMTHIDHHEMCVAWDTSGGDDPGLFSDEVNVAQAEGRVSRHLATDEPTIFELVWSVLEGAPDLMAKKSRVIVPIFLEFLHYQYFAYYDNDPDARELCLQNEVESRKVPSQEKFGGIILQKRLASILKAFAVVNGPRQLYKHDLLMSIFNSFVSHREAAVAQAALSCVLKFKQPYVLPYADQLKGMLKKGELRHTMLHFNMSEEAGIIDPEHRASLIPLVTRILFGRLSARVSISKSSKETPSARRAAVLSFLSELNGRTDELYPLFYLMVRSYIPKEKELEPMEKQKKEERKRVVVWLEEIQAADVAHLRDQRHEGFLNLLSSLISQLGHDIEKFIPAFMSISLALCKHSEVKQGREVDVDVDTEEPEAMESDALHHSTNRRGAIRTLCFRRLADMYQKYASSIDFFPYANLMWEAIDVSVRELPVTVAYADKAPALLSLLQTLSSHPRLIPILAECEEAVSSVMKCISDSSKQSVASAALDFVDNLLTNAGTDSDDDFSISIDHAGVKLIEKHLPLLLHQFAVRLGSNSGRTELFARVNGILPQNKGIHSHFTTRRELSILCRLSSLIVRPDLPDHGTGDVGAVEQDVLQTLCELLIPFLSPDRRANELDQLNVIGILSALFPRIDGATALSLLPSLSRLLGPFKARRGITSLAVRKCLASVIETITDGIGGRENIQAVARVTVRLCSIHPKRVDEIDYDDVLSALNDLGATDDSTRGWIELVGTVPSGTLHDESDPTILSPLICLCFHFILDDDGVVSRAAFKGLKTLISCAAVQSKNHTVTLGDSAPTDTLNKWAKLIETSIVPVCRTGLTSRSQSIRRLFILLFAEVARGFQEYTSPNLYGDLSLLIRDDDPDLDFFLNVTHVQIHRRSRAFQRLRKTLAPDSRDAGSLFSMQSLSNVLLPLCMHPIFESKTTSESALALEAINTVGAVAKHLSWSKYHSSLWTLLTQFDRHPEQERYLVGAVCSMIDAFHFELLCEPQIVTCGERDTEMKENNAVWRAMERRIIPKTESLLIKEKVDRRGTKVKSLRSSVVLALLKLFQKFPEHFFESRLGRLLTIICDALKSQDSDARDVARQTLAKMAAEMDMKYLSDIIKQLAVTLKEGYQLHVRMATMHTILQELLKVYQPPRLVTTDELSTLSFDKCIPAMMDLIQQDLFGIARERKEAEGARKRVVKEASGSKSLDSIELLCRMLVFRPSALTRKASCNTGAISGSSIHSVVSPLLERLRTPDIDTLTTGRIGECLTRVVVGLSHNETATAQEILPFVYASIAPFIGDYPSVGSAGDRNDSESSEDEGSGKEIRISKAGTYGRSRSTPTNRTNKKKGACSSMVEWRPSTLKAAKNSIDAREMKAKEREDLHRVVDGASAPKLTGSGRFTSISKSSTRELNEPASISAVTFGLGLLYSSLKKAKFDLDDDISIGMLDPFIQVLTTCVCECRNNEVILSSLRCLGVLLRMDLPSISAHSAALGTETLDILTSSGNLANLHQDQTQACFKTLTLLIQLDRAQANKTMTVTVSINGDGEKVLQKGDVMPLDEEQMQVLISLLKAAVIESNHHHPTLGLIKAIVSRRYVSPEFYDLMDTMLDTSVRSQKTTLRQLSAKIFMQYLVDYPMGKERLEDHLKQVVLNVKYEYEEGRLSAIDLVTEIVEKLPVALLEEHAQLFFLPLVLQFVNDESKECREALSKCLCRLLNRAPMNVVQSFYDYTVRWASGAGPLQRTSLQLFGCFADARPVFIKKGDNAKELVERLCECIRSPEDEEWEIPYFALVCAEKLMISFQHLLETQVDFWIAIVKCLAHPHTWVKRISSRMIGVHLNSLDPELFAKKSSHFLVARPGSLYRLARNLCAHLDLNEAEQNEELSTCAIKSLTWVIQAMKHQPELCYHEDTDNEQDRNPVTWLMTRLSHIAKNKGTKRRQGIFKCFAAFVTYGGVSIVMPYLELMLEPLHRSIAESDQMMDSAKNPSYGQPAEESEEATLAKDVMQVLEEACGDETEAFLRAYGAVKTRAREKREKRKLEMRTEAVRDPQAASIRKMKKHEQEKKRRKRKVDERRNARGGKAKRQHL